jgi:hypothetical protein
MYSKQETAFIRKKFWTGFGQYMKPLPGVDGTPVNWLNYKTGVKYLFFRLDVDNKRAGIGIEIRHPDPVVRTNCYQKLEQFKSILHQITGEEWVWQLQASDEDGQLFSYIKKTLEGVDIFNLDDWPAIITFFKTRMILLDEFWDITKENFI